VRKRVYVDTNLILTAHAHRLWKEIAFRHRVETVVQCVLETHTGLQNRDPETWIDDRELRTSLARPPHEVTDLQRARVLLMEGGPALHDGERDLWAHALDDPEAWLASGPDTASNRFGILNGHADRLVSLEDLVAHRKGFARIGVPSHYCRKWLGELKTRELTALLSRSGTK